MEPFPTSGRPPKLCCKKTFFGVVLLENLQVLRQYAAFLCVTEKMCVRKVSSCMLEPKSQFFCYFSLEKIFWKIFCALDLVGPQGQVRIFLFGQ